MSAVGDLVTAAVQSMGVYYARRAASYERIYAKSERQAELHALEAWLPACFTGRHVLEVACGTGWWTPHGARDAASWLATDLNPETLAIARTKALPPHVRLAIADAYTLDGLQAQRFDAAFAGFWWSHVPCTRLPAWLALLHARLQPSARVVMLDNRYVEGSSTPISRIDAAGDGWQQRRLDDGSTHEVLKNFPSRDEALARLAGAARSIEWIEHPHYWALSYQLA